MIAVYRYTDDENWCRLACSMALLQESDLSHTSTVPLAEQLLYLAHGEQALAEQLLGELDHAQDEHPPGSDVIPKSLLEKLQKIPLSIDYYGSVLSSLQTHPQFWERWCGSSASEEGRVMNDFSEYPWSTDGATGLGLDDYVMLKCLDEEGFQKKVSILVSPLVDSVSVPLLSDVLQASPAQPILLFYEEACPRSQALMHSLEEEIRNTFKVQYCCVCYELGVIAQVLWLYLVHSCIDLCTLITYTYVRTYLQHEFLVVQIYLRSQ